jgi:Putative DNA-binding domain
MPRQPDAVTIPVMRLRRLQQDLQSHLLGGNSAIADAIVDAPPLPVAARLGIYRDGYRVRLIEALDDTYPLLHLLLGDEAFDALGGAFVAAHPSVHRSIRWYGRELPEFMRRSPPHDEQPILAELALLEWTLAEVFDAADAESKPRAAFSAVDPSAWSELRFEFHPSLRRLHLRWNTAAVWQALSRGEVPPAPMCAEHAVPWLLWRQNLQNYFRSMAADEAVALDCALHGRSFGEICEALSEWLPGEEIPLRAAGLLGLWADSGIIVSIA